MLTGGREGQQTLLIAAEARAPEILISWPSVLAEGRRRSFLNFRLTVSGQRELKPGYNHGLARPPVSGDCNYSETPTGLPWSESIRYPPNYNCVEAAPYYYHSE